MSHISANEDDLIGKTRESFILIAEANMRQLRFVNCSEETFLAINYGAKEIIEAMLKRKAFFRDSKPN